MSAFVPGEVFTATFDLYRRSRPDGQVADPDAEDSWRLGLVEQPCRLVEERNRLMATDLGLVSFDCLMMVKPSIEVLVGDRVVSDGSTYEVVGIIERSVPCLDYKDLALRRFVVSPAPAG